MNLFIETNELVSELWKNRLEMAYPNKVESTKIFFNEFPKVIKELHSGKIYSIEDMKKSSYWTYISRYHKSWRSQSPEAIKAMQNKFQDAIDLFYDIKKNGMKNPIDIVVDGEKRLLNRGARRLVILHIIGTHTARVKNEIINHS